MFRLHNKTQCCCKKDKASYSDLGMRTVWNPQGLLASHPDARPADILVPAMVHTTRKALALDVAVVDPVSKSAIEANPNCKPLKTSESKEQVN